MKNLLGKFHAELSQQRLASQAEPSQAKPSRAEPSRAKPSQAKPSQVCLFIFYLSGKFHEKFVRKISCVFCQENFMKNLLGKFHAELSQQRLASQAKPSQAKPSRAEPSRAKQSQAKPSQVCLPRLTTAYHCLPRLTTAYLFFICHPC